MIVLGLDISMTATGWAIAALKDGELRLLRCGVITTEKNKSKEKVSSTIDSIRRSHSIYVELGKVLSSELGLQVDLVCMEAMSWPRNAASAIKMAMAWGAIAPLLAERPLIEVGPVAIKLVASGKKSASKEEVASGVRALMPKATQKVLKEFVPKASLQEHCWDALGSILASTKTEKWKLLQAGLSQRKPLKAGSGHAEDFRYSTFEISQRFHEGFDPEKAVQAFASVQDRVAAEMRPPSP